MNDSGFLLQKTRAFSNDACSFSLPNGKAQVTYFNTYPKGTGEHKTGVVKKI
jgi:hypothetical protein